MNLMCEVYDLQLKTKNYNKKTGSKYKITEQVVGKSLDIYYIEKLILEIESGLAIFGDTDGYILNSKKEMMCIDINMLESVDIGSNNVSIIYNNGNSITIEFI